MKTTLTPAHLRRIKKVKGVVIRVEPYGRDVVIFTNMKTLVEDSAFVFGVDMLEPHSVDENTLGLAFVASVEEDATYCIGFNGDKYREETIWHEALHTTVDVLNYHGVQFTSDNHEPFAYTQGYLVSQIRNKVYGLPEFGYDD